MMLQRRELLEQASAPGVWSALEPATGASAYNVLTNGCTVGLQTDCKFMW